MKLSKDYYHNRKLLRELKVVEGKFRPKVKDMKEWFHILNQQFFSNRLPMVNKFVVENIEDNYAYYCYHDNKKHPDYGKTRIIMDKKYPSKKIFVEVLAHEMIHHFQNLHNERVGHGATFVAWRDNFKAKGINLYKV